MQVMDNLGGNRCAHPYRARHLIDKYDVSYRALKHYEEKGLLSPRRFEGVPMYSERDKNRLGSILHYKELGFTLNEISMILSKHSEDYVKDQLRIKRAQIQKLQVDLDRTIANIDHVLEQRKR